MTEATQHRNAVIWRTVFTGLALLLAAPAWADAASDCSAKAATSAALAACKAATTTAAATSQTAPATQTSAAPSTAAQVSLTAPLVSSKTVMESRKGADEPGSKPASTPLATAGVTRVDEHIAERLIDRHTAEVWSALLSGEHDAEVLAAVRRVRAEIVNAPDLFDEIAAELLVRGLAGEDL